MPELGDRRAGLLAGEIGEVARGHAPSGGVEDEGQGSHGVVHGPTTVGGVAESETELIRPVPVLDSVGGAPWPGQWPEDPRYDPELLEAGDRRNVEDRYRDWSVEAIAADLDTLRTRSTSRRELRHDFNIGSMVRSANAFLARSCTSSARRGGTAAGRWSPTGTSTSGTTPTSRRWTPGPEAGLSLLAWTTAGGRPRETVELPERASCCSGRGPRALPPRRSPAATSSSIGQFGSTRSINAGAAAGIAMHAWVRAARGDRAQGER